MSDRLVAIPQREPPPGDLWGPEVTQMSGLEMLRASLEHKLPDAPISKLAGLRLSDASLGTASASMPASPWWQSGAGVFLAGTLAFTADMPLGGAILTSAPPGWGITTQSCPSTSCARPPFAARRSLREAA